MSSDIFLSGRNARIAWMKEEAKKRLLLLDGSWGVMIQGFKLGEEDFRGARFGNHPSELKGNNDLLTLTKPEIIQDIGRQYLEAGVDFIATITFDQLRETYRNATHGLIRGGSDVLMIETVFDTLNCKAAIFAIEEVFAQIGLRLPVWISGTITDLSGRTLTGQTPEAFWHSVRHANPFAIGLNCALGAKELRPYIAYLASAC